MIRICALFLLFSSCVDPFSFSSEVQKQPFLIVDGFIDNETTIYTVSLKRSASFLSSDDYNGTIKSEGFIKAESGATVKIIDENGHTLELFETKKNTGIYQSLVGNEMKGEIGITYHISIITNNGEKYESIPEILKPSPKIDSVYGIYETHKKLDNNVITDVSGIQYYANINFDKDDDYYMFKYEETYILETPIHRIPLLLPPYPKFCYITEKGNSHFNLLASNTFDTKKITAHRLDFIRPSYKYNEKHSYRIIQYSISKNAYAFFNMLHNQLGTTGSVFDPTPSQITGNVYNINNKNEVVLGYFGAYGVTSKRTFISKKDLPNSFKKGKLSECFVGCPPPINNCLELYCFDCSKYPGSDTQKPNFWE